MCVGVVLVKYMIVDDADVYASCGLRFIWVNRCCVSCRLGGFVLNVSFVLYLFVFDSVVISRFVSCDVGWFGSL